MKLVFLRDFSRVFNELLKHKEIQIKGFRVGKYCRKGQWIAIDCESFYNCTVMFMYEGKNQISQIRYLKKDTFECLYFNSWDISNYVASMCKWGEIK